MIVLYFLFICMTLYEMKILPHGVHNEQYLTKDSCNSYKGLCSILVIITHTQAWCTDDIIINSIGLYPVAIFFFISGYGLAKRYIEDPFYYKGFMMNRIIAGLAIPYFIMNIIYWCYHAINGKLWSLKEIFSAIVSDRMLVAFSWYIIAILLFYMWFWILMLLFRNKYWLLLAGIFLFYIVYEYVCLKNNMPGQWYLTIHMIIVGMVWVKYEESIIYFIRKYYLYFSTLLLALCTILYAKFNEIIEIGSHIPYFSLLFYIIVVFLFVLLLLVILQKIRIGNNISYFLGARSLEIYMVHGLIMMLTRDIVNDKIWCGVVLIFSIVVSVPLHILFNMIRKRLKIMTMNCKI